MKLNMNILLISITQRRVLSSAKFGTLASIIPKIYVTCIGNSLNFCSVAPSTPNILQPVNRSSSTTLRVKKISNAMKAYLERAKRHEEFIITKSEEFEIGRQHLANIMGLDVNNMTQNDIDRAIVYLLPSGLYEPKARPVMKPPNQLYPKEKAAQFDDSGRPFNTFFYTNKANFYTYLHETVTKFHELDAFEDKMIQKGFSEVPTEKRLNLNGSEWLSIDVVRGIFLETIFDTDYQFLLTTLNRLANHPYSFRCKDHIWKFRKDFEDCSVDEIPEPLCGENNQLYAEYPARKHTSHGIIRVYANGTGQVKINGLGIYYFNYWQEREQVMFPLEISGMLGKVDIEATIEGGGYSSQANCIRYGISMCLRCFVPEEVRERMRLAGLLSFDKRHRERKKPGQKGSRAKYKWRKR